MKDLTNNALQLLKQRYFHENEDWIGLVNRVVNHVCVDENDSYKTQVTGDLLNRVWLPNSPCLVNAGKKNAGLFACFVVGPEEDTLENHFETLTDIAAVAKSGGGAGWSGVNIRPHNSPVAGSAHGYAYGPNRFAGMVSHAMDIMTQSGFRKMALMTVLPCDHKDIEEFIYLKQTEDESELYNFNQSVLATDEFMRLAQFPDTREHYLFHKICTHAWNCGEPGLLFDGNINKPGLPYFDAGERIEATNPCLHKDTLVTTKNGIEKIKNLVGKNVSIWNGESWQEIDSFRMTSENEPLYKVSLQDGSEIITTAYHTFILDNSERIELRHLNVGDKLKISDVAVTDTAKDIDAAYFKGFWIGDGTNKRETPILEVYPPKYICEERLIDSLDEIESVKYSNNTLMNIDIVEETNRHVIRGVTSRRHSLMSYYYRDQGLPSEIMNASLQSKFDFIAGYFDADGSVMDGKNGFGYQISCIHLRLLQDFQILLKSIGIQGKISINKQAGVQDFNDGYGEYKTQTLYRLTIAQANSIKLSQLVNFTRLKSLHNKTVKYNTKLRWNQIVNIEYYGEEEVYCCTVDGNHQFALANNIDIGQCGEQPIPPYLSCNLGSINLSHDVFYNEDGYFDYNELIQVTRRITRFLDNVGTANVFPNDKFKKRYEDFRPIGVGIMGVADAMLRLQLRYGSEDSLAWLENVLELIKVISYDTSKELGVERGVPNGCKKVNRRNITVQSIAPTGSIAIISGCSHGIEPIFSPSYTRIDERGVKYIVNHELKDEPYFSSCIGHENSPSVQNHLDILILAQQFVDSGVSKTINLPNDATVSDVEKVFIQAWENGVKGITVYRDGSREFQVLNNNETPTEDDAALANCPTGVCAL